MNWTTGDIPDQTGRSIIITGANSGIGFETARVLASRGARVVMACRSAERGERARKLICQRHPDAHCEVSVLDLADLGSIRAFVNRYGSTHSSLDTLINNAGVMVPPLGRTSDGFELQFGCNHLGHFALSAQLIDMINESPGGRVVTVSSGAHKFGKIDFDNLNAEKKYRPWPAYGQSKLANLLFTYELDRRLREAGKTTRAIAAHPGWAATNLQKTSFMLRLLNPLLAQDELGGALPTLRAAVDPDAPPGSYWGPGGFQELRGAPVEVQSSRESHNRETAACLWAVSEELSQCAFPVFLS